MAGVPSAARRVQTALQDAYGGAAEAQPLPLCIEMKLRRGEAILQTSLRHLHRSGVTEVTSQRNYFFVVFAKQHNLGYEAKYVHRVQTVCELEIPERSPTSCAPAQEKRVIHFLLRLLSNGHLLGNVALRQNITSLYSLTTFCHSLIRQYSHIGSVSTNPPPVSHVQTVHKHCVKKHRSHHSLQWGRCVDTGLRGDSTVFLIQTQIINRYVVFQCLVNLHGSFLQTWHAGKKNPHNTTGPCIFNATLFSVWMPCRTARRSTSTLLMPGLDYITLLPLYPIRSSQSGRPLTTRMI